jgi:hypothetical protein
VGAPKAGTTSLYYYLNEHPEVEMSREKEPDYFSDESIQKQDMYYGNQRINSEEKYHSLFNKESKDIVFGEASVSYLFYENVAEDIKKYNPNAKIIIMLRNPIDRAFSHYLMDYRLGLVSDSFEDIINKKSKHKDAHLFYQQYIEVSEYSNQIERYLKEFDAKNILFIDYEDFKIDTREVVRKAYDFLDINSEYIAEINKKHNTFTMPKNNFIRFIYSFVFIRNILTVLFTKKLIISIRFLLFKQDKKPVLFDETRKQLEQYFKKDVLKLNDIMNKDFSKWIKLD